MYIKLIKKHEHFWCHLPHITIIFVKMTPNPALRTNSIVNGIKSEARQYTKHFISYSVQSLDDKYTGDSIHRYSELINDGNKECKRFTQG